MARFALVQQTPGAEPARLRLAGEILIGREADCAVVLQDDLVSRHHARVLLKDSRVVLRDLGSTNGTTLDGARVTEVYLRPGQSFIVGRTTFVLAKEDDTAEVPAPGAPADLQTTFTVVEGEEGSVYEARATAGIRADHGGDRTQPLTLEQLAALSQRLAALNRIGSALASILEVETLLGEVVEQVFGLFPRADRCCVLMEEGGELRPVRARVRGKAAGDPGAFRLSRTVLSLNRDERKSVLSFDTATDQRLSAAKSIVASGIRSIMSVPILQKSEFFGILYLDTADIGAPFSADDLDMLASLASQVAVFVKNARLVGQIARETELRTNLGRYLSPSVVAEIAEGRLVPSLGGETREGTVLFGDVVGFTSVCRDLAAAEVVSLLNRFFRDLVDAVFRWNGTVDKFGGDAMLCVWGAPVAMQDHAGPAVAAALEMQNRLYGFNLALASSGSAVRIRMGIGLNSGSFIAGNVGSERRLEYTVIGDDVNLAQRVEEKATGGMVLVSAATRALVPGAASVRMRPTTIRGAAGEVVVHSLRAAPRSPGGRERSLLASLPARCGRAGSSSRVEAVVVGFERSPPGPVLTVRVPAASGLAEATALEVEPLLPELPGTPVLAGGVLRPRPPEEGKPWRDVDVLVPGLPADLEALLRPGGTVDSPLAPEGIPRA
jgi:adenylate cyclase